MTRFPYYNNLTLRQKRIYRQSDAVERLELGPNRARQEAARGVEEALRSENLRLLRLETERLCAVVCDDLRIRRAAVVVRARRPSNRRGELMGLYELDEKRGPVITLWAKTARRRQMVSFKTYLRTLIHELCHHVDFVHFRLPESFHTQGFFRRESSLLRSVLPDDGAAARDRKAKEPEKPPAAGGQLTLF
jgi:hypothetical protein